MVSWKTNAIQVIQFQKSLKISNVADKKNDLVGINPEVVKKYGLGNGEWELAQYTFVNPTSSRVNFSPFNPQTSVLFNYPTAPTNISSLLPSVYVPITIAPVTSVAVAYDTNNNKVWFGNNVGSSICTYSDNPPQTSPATFNTIAIPAQVNVTGIAFSPTSNVIAVVSSGGFVVTFIDATTEVVLANTPIGFLGANWIEYNSINNSFYVSTSNNFVGEFDAVTFAQVGGLIPLGIGVTPQRIAFDSNSNNIYIADDALGNNQIFKVDCTINAVVSTIPTGLQINSPYSVGFNSATNKLYVGSLVNLGIWTLDTLTDTFISNIAPTKRAVDFLVHVSSNSVYAVGAIVNGELNRFNGTSDTLEFTTLFTNTVNSISLAYSPVQNIIYSSSSTVAPFQLNSFIPSQVPTFYILSSGASDYNQDVRDFFNNPAWIRKIFIYSDNSTNFNQIFSQITKDANGNALYLPQNAGISVGVMQFQQRIGELDFPNKDLILGINQWFEGLTIEPNSQYTMILVFQQIEKADLLSHYPLSSKHDIDDLAEYVNQINPIKKYSLQDLNRVMPLNSGEFKSVQPFSISKFNQLLIEETKTTYNGSNKTE